MKTATSSWQPDENDPQRVAILAAADRLLAGAPIRSTGNLSVVQLAAEAGIKYWVIAQKHTDLRDHFQLLTAQARRTATAFADNHDALTRLQCEHAELKAHCDGLEELLQNYARIINELTQQNADPKEQATTPQATIRTLHPRRGHEE